MAVAVSAITFTQSGMRLLTSPTVDVRTPSENRHLCMYNKLILNAIYDSHQAMGLCTGLIRLTENLM